jgi:hypothetical protein
MRLSVLLVAAIVFFAVSCGRNSSKVKGNTSGCSDDCKATSKEGTKIACKLTTPELRQRKETVLASLKSQVIEKKELKDGYAFKFNGSDKMLDELTEFIKTERECCDFFTFNLSIAGDKNTTWLELTGAEGAKEFIGSELGL